ncbi:MAG: TROVE domain-containing protein [Lewinellaceae bacterium]|nr:TROVE domain-containing protein [Saprospiraceae bacterium]MCB9337138.1 TROVE domain-containing protein [Lewinellaceae bacterium]
MARFNFFARKNNQAVNLAGGNAFEQSPKMQLASLLLTSFAQDQYYRNANQSFDQLKALLAKVEPEFAAKAAIYARTTYCMRSITHVLAAELAKYAAGQPWAKGFYEKIIARPDDMTEILSVVLAVESNKLPNAMRKGFAKAFDKFDGYQLAKYRSEGKGVKLVDVANLVHPVPVERNAEALRQLIAGTLRNVGTWEAKLTQAGQASETDDEKTGRKAEAWADLVRSRKIGYFALLRNLRNIAEQAPALIQDVCDLLTNKRLIEKSLVLPFRFTTAMEAIQAADIVDKRPLMQALNRAIDLALSNVPHLAGRTLVVLDDSGSMMGKPIKIGALFASVLYRSNDADLMRFSDDASYVAQNPDNPVMTIAEYLEKNARSGGTNFNAIFQRANQRYDRIVILSDMQGWVSGGAPTAAFAAYKAKFGADPFVYSFDLQGYGSLQFPEQKVFALAGFSEKAFELMALLESDPQALVGAIEQVALV